MCVCISLAIALATFRYPQSAPESFESEVLTDGVCGVKWGKTLQMSFPIVVNFHSETVEPLSLNVNSEEETISHLLRKKSMQLQ